MTAKPIIGETYQDIKLGVERYAKENLPILLIGETGTGKELFAKLYMEKNKKTGTKMTVNCAAFPDTLLRSEVFGYVKGAFTDAVKDRDGKLKTCHKGILFLDELGDASQEFQAAILRAVEGNSYSPVGSDKEETSNTLIIAATSKPSKVREDLKQRFHLVPIPPLQKSDIPLLAKHFLGKKFKESVLHELMDRNYPGNVRQLEKQCEEILIEKNKTIFGKSEHYPQIINLFDYARYKKEIETWNEHIQPILDSNQINEFEYAYQEWNDTWDEHKNDTTSKTNLLIHGRWSLWWTEATTEAPKKDDPFSYGIIDLIEGLKKYFHKEKDVLYDLLPFNHTLSEAKEDALLPMFRHHLRGIFEFQSLPYLLKLLHQTYSRNPIVSQKKPSISFLLDLSPEDAVNKFKKIYYEYNLTLNNGSIAATATALGLNKATLKSKLRRLHIDSI